MPDRSIILFTVIVCTFLATLVALIVGVHVEPYILVYQNDSLIGSCSVAALDHPVVVSPSGEAGPPTKVGMNEPLLVSPYDRASQSTSWRFVADAPEGSSVRYVCRLDYRAGYTVYLFGWRAFSGLAPGGERTWTLIEASVPSSASGQWNVVYMPEHIYPVLSGDSLPTYTG